MLVKLSEVKFHEYQPRMIPTVPYGWTGEQTDRPCDGNGHFSKLCERD